MATDLVGLKVELEKLRYNTAIRAGGNNELVTLLHVPKGATKRWRPILVDDFLGAIAGETLTPDQEERIRTYTQLRAHVPVHKAGVQTWILGQGWSTATIDALKALSQVPTRYADAFLGEDDDEITLGDVRKVVRMIAKSHIVASGQA